MASLLACSFTGVCWLSSKVMGRNVLSCRPHGGPTGLEQGEGWLGVIAFFCQREAIFILRCFSKKQSPHQDAHAR